MSKNTATSNTSRSKSAPVGSGANTTISVPTFRHVPMKCLQCLPENSYQNELVRDDIIRPTNDVLTIVRHNAQTILAMTRSGCADPFLQDSPVWRIVVVVVVVVLVGVEKDGRNKTLFNHLLDHGVRKDFDDPLAFGSAGRGRDKMCQYGFSGFPCGIQYPIQATTVIVVSIVVDIAKSSSPLAQGVVVVITLDAVVVVVSQPRCTTTAAGEQIVVPGWFPFSFPFAVEEGGDCFHACLVNYNRK